MMCVARLNLTLTPLVQLFAKKVYYSLPPSQSHFLVLKSIRKVTTTQTIKNVYAVGIAHALYLYLLMRYQVQGYIEQFSDSCKGPIGWIADNTLYLTFSEGWALYTENPLIPQHTTAYDSDPISKYGMLKWQVSSQSHLTLRCQLEQFVPTGYNL